MLLKRPMPKPAVPAKPAAKAAPAKSAAAPKAAPDTAERSTKSVTIRMPPSTLDMLDNVVGTYESDRTEVVKRAIRLLNAALSGENSVLTITGSDGKAKEIHLVIDGIPT